MKSEVVITMRRASDGLVRTWRDSFEEDTLALVWSEDSYACDYACDCNRALFFGRAGGESETAPGDCGEGGYVVMSISRASDGEVLFSEDPVGSRLGPDPTPSKQERL